MPDAMKLVIADDGVGFDPTAVPPDRFGLIGMNERVRLLNGRFHLQSAPGEGTHIEMVLPG
jgi:two-component system NarL family sensor kinase